MEKNTEITFYSDSSHNYMVLECPPQIRDNYQYKMLAANQIRGLLPCSSRTIDNREYLYYDISSRQSLTDLYDRRPVRGTDLHALLESLIRTEATLTEYLLDAAHLLLDPACIYVDFSEQSYSFTYYPGEEQEKGWETLFTYLADRVEGRDKEAAALIYRLCMMAERPGFRLRAEVLQELGMQISNTGREEKFSGPATGRDRQMAGLFPEADREPEYAGKGKILYGRSPVYGRNPGCGRSREYESRPEFRTTPDLLQDPDRNPDLFFMENGKDLTAWREMDGGDYIDTDCLSGGNMSEDRYRRTAGDRTNRTRNTEGWKTGPGEKIWIPVLGGVLLTAGLILFFLNRWMFLEERELLLTHALGGTMAAAGIIAAAVWMVCRFKRKQKTPKQEEREKDAWKQLPQNRAILSGEVFPGEVSGKAAAENYYEQGYGSTQYYGSSLAAGQNGSPYPSMGLQAPVAETCLLSRNPGMDAGLYGTGNYRGEQVDLTNLPCVVGKIQEYVDQVLNDSSVSRMHARFSQDQEGRMTVRDLNSTNGTWLNGERLQPNESRLMERGDHLRLGRMEFVFR